MDKCFRLELVGPVKSGEVVHISGIRSHAPALGAAVVPPWPRQGGWQRRLNVASHAGRRGKS